MRISLGVLKEAVAGCERSMRLDSEGERVRPLLEPRRDTLMVRDVPNKVTEYEFFSNVYSTVVGTEIGFFQIIRSGAVILTHRTGRVFTHYDDWTIRLQCWCNIIMSFIYYEEQSFC